MNNLEKEIKEFKNEVFCKGMELGTYLNKRKELIKKIDYASEKSIKFFICLLYLGMITQKQYLDMKFKIVNLRKRYKSMLSMI